MREFGVLFFAIAMASLAACGSDDPAGAAGGGGAGATGGTGATGGSGGSNVTGGAGGGGQDTTCGTWGTWVSGCANCTISGCDSGYASLTADMKEELDACAAIVQARAGMCWGFDDTMAPCVSLAQSVLGLNCAPAPYCGDGNCDQGETEQSCDMDCTTPVCGDSVCSDGEAQSCPDDCAAQCGNTYCETGEDWKNCAQDCPKTTCDYFQEWADECPGCAFGVDCEPAYTGTDLGTKTILDDCRTTVYSNRGTCDPTGNQDLEWCVGYAKSVFKYACE